MRCIDVTALVAAAVVRANREALVLPFEQRVRETTQAAERADVMNVGGFSDEVFEIEEQARL